MTLPSILRVSARTLLRAPAFAATTVLTLALGIGLSTAVFTVADALLLRKLPLRDQERIVTLWLEKRDGTAPHWPLTITEAREFGRRARTLSEYAYADYYGALPVPILDDGNISQLRRALVSGSYFGVLGARAALGRTIAPTDDLLGAAPVIVLSDATWRRQFGGDSSAVGRRITLQQDGVAHEIVGVMPAGFEYPRGTDFWGPYTPTRLRTAADSGLAAVDIIGRLANGATPVTSQAELTTFITRPEAPAAWRDFRGAANSLERVLLGDVRPAVFAFIAAATLLLLITCTNVANLLLVRGLARVREIAVRTAMGASRTRIIAQLLTENAVLAIAGGIAGIGVAMAAVRGFIALAPEGLPLIETVGLNGAALTAAVVTTAFALLAFGVAPAVLAARTDAHEALRSGARHTPSRAVRAFRETLVGAQVALAVLVLSGAALIGRSLMKLQNATLAFDSSRLVVAELGVRYDQHNTLERQLGVVRAVLERVRATPGVEAASPIVAVPFSGTSGWTGRAAAAGQAPEAAAKNAMFNMELVTPDYFPTFGLRVLRGRALNAGDVRGSESVVVVSEGTARAYWPNQDAIGKRLVMGRNLDRYFTVVGVVPDTRYRDLREAMPSVYFPLAQSMFPFAPTTIAIRASGSIDALVPVIRAAVADAAPGVLVSRAAGFNTYTRGPLAQPRLNAFLLSIFGLAATVLAALGLFGVMGTIVRQSVPQLGIRMALGATSRRILLMVLGRGLLIAGAGVAVGLGGALLGNQLLSSLLYGVTPTDPPTLIAVSSLLLGVALAGAYLPARFASRVDPAIALRQEG